MQFCNEQIRTQPLFSPPCASATYGSTRICRRKNVALKRWPFIFFRSSIKFQGHTGWKVDDLNPIWIRLLGRSQLWNPSDLPCSINPRQDIQLACRRLVRVSINSHRSRPVTEGLVHYGVGSWSLYTKQATPGSPPLLCRGHPTQSATSTMEPQGFQWALTQWRQSPVKVTRSPWDYFLKTQNGWQPTCVDMQNNVENVFVECTIYFLTIMQLTEAGLSIWQVQ